MLVGIGIYCFAAQFSLTGFARNQLPDGLWAYAFASCILIIWRRQVNVAWLVAMAILFIALELLQHWGMIPGTADMADVMVYFLFAGAAVLLNPFFKHTIQHELG